MENALGILLPTSMFGMFYAGFASLYALSNTLQLSNVDVSPGLAVRLFLQRSAMFGTEGADVGRGRDPTREGAFARVPSTISPLWGATGGEAGV